MPNFLTIRYLFTANQSSLSVWKCLRDSGPSGPSGTLFVAVFLLPSGKTLLLNVGRTLFSANIEPLWSRPCSYTTGLSEPIITAHSLSYINIMSYADFLLCIPTISSECS